MFQTFLDLRLDFYIYIRHIQILEQISRQSYLPACSVSPEVSESRGEPVVDFVQSQLLIGGFLDGLRN
jgi:hypothetical protein